MGVGGGGEGGANTSLGIYLKIVSLRACAALVSRMLHFINFIPFLHRPVNITMDFLTYVLLFSCSYLVSLYTWRSQTSIQL